MLSLFICGTAVTSQYLAEQYQVNTPMFQSFINYALLLLVYTTMLAFRTGMWNIGWEILVHLFFVSSTFSFQILKLRNSIFIFLKFLLKFLLCNSTRKWISRVKCALNLVVFHICWKLCAVCFQVLCCIRENRLCYNKLLSQRQFNMPLFLLIYSFNKSSLVGFFFPLMRQNFCAFHHLHCLLPGCVLLLLHLS